MSKTIDLTRRGFLGAAAMAAVAGGAEGLAFAGEAAPQEAEFVPGGGSFAEGALDLGWTGTPAAIETLGGSTMPLAELNRRRRAYLDSLEDHVCEDGTVVPVEIVRVRALINTYGMGLGNTPADNSFGRIADCMTIDECKAYVEMPMGVEFTAHDFSIASGRPLEQCAEICDHLAHEGFLCVSDRPNGRTYHHLPYMQGAAEYQIRAMFDTGVSMNMRGIDMLPQIYIDNGTPFFYPIPCDASVVAETGVLPDEQIESFVNSKSLFAIAPCPCEVPPCRTSEYADEFPSYEDFHTGEYEDYFSPLTGLRVETCLQMGDEAQAWIELGLAREITREQALQFLKRSRDDGFVLQTCFAKNHEAVCSCNIKRCNVMAHWASLEGTMDWEDTKAYRQMSRYTLEVDGDACLHCGACADRCPCQAIEMDEADTPQIVGMCFRCGQCAYVCPAEARKLYPRPQEECLELPQDLLADANMKAAYRFEHGYIR